MNLGQSSSRALLFCHTAFLEKVADEPVFRKPQNANLDALNPQQNECGREFVESVQCPLMVSAGMVTSAFAQGRLWAAFTSAVIQPL